MCTKSRIVSAMLVTVGMLAAHAGVFTIGSLAEEQSANHLDKQQTEPLTVAEFEQLRQKLNRMSTAGVWSVPWQLSVREARELAAKEMKPVFLWISSNGGTHPLGPC